MRIVEIEQNTDAWITWRTAGIGASEAAAVVGVSQWMDPRRLWIEKRRSFREGPVTRQYDKPESYPMMVGKREEPKIRAAFEELTGLECPPVCGMHDKLDWLKASLDGWHADTRTVLEIKTAGAEKHAVAKAGRVPDDYWPQVVHQAIVAGVDEIIYLSWPFPTKRKPVATPADLVRVRAPVPEAAKRVLLAALTEFWESVVSGHPPAWLYD